MYNILKYFHILKIPNILNKRELFSKFLGKTMKRAAKRKTLVECKMIAVYWLVLNLRDSITGLSSFRKILFDIN